MIKLRKPLAVAEIFCGNSQFEQIIDTAHLVLN